MKKNVSKSFRTLLIGAKLYRMHIFIKVNIRDIWDLFAGNEQKIFQNLKLA